jgi:phenylpropionate dioxygenase-like ring-hydroxylating dioxygenase large terminal subunit
MSYVVDPQRALPLAAYRAEAHLLDIERVFRSDWVFVATSDQVAEPGQYVAVEVGGQPVIVLRNQAGELAALSNLCAHRGTLLVEGAGVEKRFQCPYHAWTYADDGRLLAVPHTDRGDIDRDAHCLPTYRADQWHGLVFASLNPAVAPLAERLAHLESMVADAGLDDLHHWTAERRVEEWQANWKLVMANAMESYHLFKVHPETLEPYTPTTGAYYRVGQPEGTATGGTQKGSDDYTLLSLPPNFVGVISDGNLLWQAVVPLAHDRSLIIDGGAYAHPSPSTQSGLSKWVGSTAARVMDAAVPDFLPEDKAICERGQRAATGDFEPGTLVPMERVVVDFHEYLRARLG